MFSDKSMKILWAGISIVMVNPLKIISLTAQLLTFFIVIFWLTICSIVSPNLSLSWKKSFMFDTSLVCLSRNRYMAFAFSVFIWFQNIFQKLHIFNPVWMFDCGNIRLTKIGININRMFVIGYLSVKRSCKNLCEKVPPGSICGGFPLQG